MLVSSSEGFWRDGLFAAILFNAEPLIIAELLVVGVVGRSSEKVQDLISRICVKAKRDGGFSASM